MGMRKSESFIFTKNNFLSIKECDFLIEKYKNKTTPQTDASGYDVYYFKHNELPFKQKDISLNGWAMESRIYAEDATCGFLPSTGRIIGYKEPKLNMFVFILSMLITIFVSFFVNKMRDKIL